MSHAPRFNLRNVLVAVGGLVAAIALVFGAGYVTANALGDGDGDGDGGSGSPQVQVPVNAAVDIGSGSSGRDAITTNAPGAQPAGSIPASMTDEQAARSGAPGGYSGYGLTYPGPGMPYACPAPLPEVLNGAVVDVSLAGFELTLLGDGYTLRNISVRAEGECDDQGQAESGVLVVDTSWVHGETGFEVYLSQRVSEEAVANVLTPYNAQVWADGYAFSAWVNAYAYPVKPLTDDIMPAPAEDPRVSELLKAVMAEVAPAVPDTCYYTQRAGSWDDLASLGVGDPRPAIPGGLSEQYSDFTVFDAPPADCNVPALEGAGGFSASFADDSQTYVSVSAYAVPAGANPGFGYLDEGNAYWSNGSFAFNVSGYGSGGPLGKDVIENIARSMDPNFSAACFITTRQLDPSELAGLGFGEPTPPEGFELGKSSLMVTEAPSGDCGDPPDGQNYPQYSLYWTMQDSDGVTIDASAYRYPGSAPEAGGYIYEGGLYWAAADGTQYSVSSYGPNGPSSVDRETLIAVAQSMDPSLDPSTLQEGPSDMPMREAAASNR